MSKANARQVPRDPRGACRLASIHRSVSCCHVPPDTCTPTTHLHLPPSETRGLILLLCTDPAECNCGNTLPPLPVNDTLFKWEKDVYGQIYSWRRTAEPQAQQPLPLLAAGKPRSAPARLAAQGSRCPGLAPWDTPDPSLGSAGLDPSRAHPGAPTAQKASARGGCRCLHKRLRRIRSQPVK